MALSHGKQSAASGGENFSKPVWANSGKSQLPPQVRNKLHVFENKSFESQPQPSDYPQWRSPPPPPVGMQYQHQQQHHAPGSGHHFGGNRSALFPGMKQTMSTTALNQVRDGQSSSSRGYNRPVYSSHDNVAAVSQKKLLFQGNSFDSKLNEQQQHHRHPMNMRKPTPVKSHQSFPNLQAEQSEQQKNINLHHQTKGAKPSGVHMVHATATAMEAMKQSAFVPAQSISETPAYSPGTKPSQDDKISLPWAKRDGGKESSNSNNSPTNRVQSSKNRFEPTVPFTQSFPSPPSNPPATQVSPNFPYNSNPKAPRFNNMGGSAEEFVPVARPPLKSFGVTQSFDEAFKRNLDQQVSSGSIAYPEGKGQETPPTKSSQYGGSESSINSTNKSFEPSVGSAFARQVAETQPISSPAETKKPEPPETNAEGMILTPVVSKVMRGPQQQRATMTNRVSTLQDEEQNTRLSSARSNLRNFINQYQASSPAGPSAEHNLNNVGPPPANLSPLMKSMSGDTLHLSPGSPANMANLSPKEMSRSPISAHHSPNTAMPSPPTEQQKRPVLIPRQKSLSEIPKIGNAPRIEPLRVETDIVPVRQQVKPAQPNRNAVQPHLQQQHTQHANQQNNKMNIMYSQLANSKAIQQQQQQQSSVPKPSRGYPDTLQRTSSGSSIFNRAKNLFFGNQDGAPPSTKLRPKLPSSPQSKLAFPKQFEAQMSPDSADRKQRELAAYFRQQQQQELLMQQQAQGAAGKSGGKLRKSASHSKIMHRQRSLSDEEDVDAIFESLFKASGTQK